MKSKDINITVPKEAVYLKVRKHSSYLGGKDVYIGKVGDYDRISAAEADAVMLDELWERSLPGLISLVQRYLYGSESVDKGATSVSFDLTMPTNFNALDNKPLLESACTEYMVNAILIEWLQVANADDDAKRLATDLQASVLQIKDILARREMPVRMQPDMEKVDIDVEISVD